MLENIASSDLHNIWKEQIRQNIEEHIDFRFGGLSLIKYVNESPEKFYSKSAFETYSEFLNNLLILDTEFLRSYINSNQVLLNSSIRLLTDINNKYIHEVLLPKNDVDSIRYITEEINYNYLRLIEGTYFAFIQFIAVRSRFERGKGSEGLDLYNCVNELSRSSSILCTGYDHVIRNGIAHSGVSWSNSELTFSDKRGNKRTIHKRDMVRLFDKIVDTCNGMVLALKTFFFKNFNKVESLGLIVPQEIFFKEIQSQVALKEWEVIATCEGQNIENSRQINIYLKNHFWDLNKVLFSSLQTAYLTSKYTQEYDRIYLILDSSHSKWRTGGCGFDAKELRRQFLAGSTLKEFSRVVDYGGLIFHPKYKLPRFIYTFGTYKMLFQYKFRAIHHHFNIRREFALRETQFHRKTNFTIIQDPSIVVNSKFRGEILQFVKENYESVIRYTIRLSRKEISLFNLTRYLPVKHIRVFIYQKEMRMRSLRNSGLIEDLICTIEVNKTKKIPTIDILGGKVENYGQYRIVWNKNWTEFDSIFSIT